MRATFLVALLAACVLRAGGGDSSPEPVPALAVTQPAKLRFAARISFGDNLSDIGSDAVLLFKTLVGRKFTIDGDSTKANPASTGQNWIERLAKRLNLPAPCAVQTRLDGNASTGFFAAVSRHAVCFGDAQVNARVTNPVVPTNKLTGSPLGASSVPVATQISRHLERSGGKFQPGDLVLVMAGDNNLQSELEEILAEFDGEGEDAGTWIFYDTLASLLAGDNYPDEEIYEAMLFERANPNSTDSVAIMAGIATAAALTGHERLLEPAVHEPLLLLAHRRARLEGMSISFDEISYRMPFFVGAMKTAGSELAAQVKDGILANGAQYVVINTVPDGGWSLGSATDASVQLLLAQMAQSFNEQLRTALADDPRVLLVDAYEFSQDAAKKPSTYGLVNVIAAACDFSPAKNPLKSLHGCNASAPEAADISHDACADGVPPTPFFQSMLTDRVVQGMKAKGWLL